MITVGQAVAVFVDVARDLRRYPAMFAPSETFDEVPDLVPRFRLVPEEPVTPELPVLGRISSRFGPRWGRPHYGVDIAAPTGTPVRAPQAGVVVFAGVRGAYGNAIMLNHGQGRQTLYGHLSRIDVAVGDTVQAGDTIGAVGSTGRSTGPHCHFERRIHGRRIDPLQGWG